MKLYKHKGSLKNQTTFGLNFSAWCISINCRFANTIVILFWNFINHNELFTTKNETNDEM